MDRNIIFLYLVIREITTIDTDVYDMM